MAQRIRRNFGSFPHQRVFDYAGLVYHFLSDELDRTILNRRVRSFAFNGRRGNLKLPTRFPRELRTALSKMTKSQLRQAIYWVKPNTMIDQQLKSASIDFIHRCGPGMLWTGVKENFHSCARRVDTSRLAKRDWPRSSRPLWPSSPSFTEMVVMSRSGHTISGYWKPPFRVKQHVTWNQLREDPGLASRIVAENIIGVRSNASIPTQFLRWFRYSRGFLILTVRHNIPIGLARSLLAIWKTGPASLWLRVKCRLKFYLRLSNPSNKVRRTVLSEPTLGVDNNGSGSGTPSLASVNLELTEDRVFWDLLMSKLEGSGNLRAKN